LRLKKSILHIWGKKDRYFDDLFSLTCWLLYVSGGKGILLPASHNSGASRDSLTKRPLDERK